jgi:hypothetical protein
VGTVIRRSLFCLAATASSAERGVSQYAEAVA